MDYGADLQALKLSFRGGGEGAFYLRMLERVADRAHLDWLDIGVGRDGSALRPFVKVCRQRGQTLAITGIDPDALAALWSEEGVAWRLDRTTFEAWQGGGTFDIVNADQSLYYAPDIGEALARATRALKLGGLFIATCWSRDDALFRLRQQLFPGEPDALVGEDLVARLQALPQLGPVLTTEFRTEVNFDAWRAEPALLEPALRVIARSAHFSDLPLRVSQLSKLLGSLPDVASRINLAMCVQRA